MSSPSAGFSADGAHLAVCCQLRSSSPTGISDFVVDHCVVAPMIRHGGKRMVDVEGALYFEFVGTSNPGHTATRATLEVAARLRNASVAQEFKGHVRIGIACHEQDDSQAAATRSALRRRARDATRLARDSEIVAEHSLATLLDFELSCTPLGVRAGVGTKYVSVHGMRDGRSRMLQARRQTRAVFGRDDELALLSSIEDSVLSGRGQVVGISGRAGSGKTFLLSNVADRWIRAGGHGYISRCKPSTQRTCLYPVYACLQSLAATDCNHAVEAPEESILAALRLLGGSTSQLATLEALVRGDLGGEAPWHLLDEWLGDMVEKQTRHSPMLQIFEDLHFADPATLRFISTVARVAHRGRILVVASYRASRSLGTLRRSLHNEVLLSSLGSQDLIGLVRQHSRVEEVDFPLVDLLLSRTDGTPGSVVEFVGLLASNNLLTTHQQRLSITIGRQEAALGLAKTVGSQTPPAGTPLLALPGGSAHGGHRFHVGSLRTSTFCARRPTSRTRMV